jgi:hypothetical protein
MKKTLQLIILLVSYSSIAQPTLAWQKCLGGTLIDYGYASQQTSDGGFIIINYVGSNDGEVSGNHSSNTDVWVVKLSSLGVIEWQKCLGGSSADDGYSIKQTTDGGYILTSNTFSNDGDVTGFHGGQDIWVVKLSSLGVIEWQKCFGGNNGEFHGFISQTTDGGYIFTSFTMSNDGDVSGNHGSGDVWVVKLTSLGVIQWQKCFGGSLTDTYPYIQATSDGGYILCCESKSNDGNVSGNHVGKDAWVVKLSSLGVIEWQKSFGGFLNDSGRYIQQTLDGGYIFSGYTMSNDGDVSGNHGGNDAWIVKLSSQGLIQWQKCLGGSGDEFGFAIDQTTDGGYILSGSTMSNDGDVSGNHGGNDAWVVKLSSQGLIQWQKCIGGSGSEYGFAIDQTTDGGYILSGGTSSNDGDVIGNHGANDGWVVKLSADLGMDESSYNNLVSFSPNPVTNILNVNVGDNMVNQTYTITDILGKLITQGKLNANSSSINVEYLSKGVYFIKVADNKDIKFLKE